MYRAENHDVVKREPGETESREGESSTEDREKPKTVYLMGARGVSTLTGGKGPMLISKYAYATEEAAWADEERFRAACADEAGNQALHALEPGTIKVFVHPLEVKGSFPRNDGGK